MSTRVLNNVTFIKLLIEDRTLIKFQMDADDVWPPGALFPKGYDTSGQGV